MEYLVSPRNVISDRLNGFNVQPPVELAQAPVAGRPAIERKNRRQEDRRYSATTSIASSRLGVHRISFFNPRVPVDQRIGSGGTPLPVAGKDTPAPVPHDVY